MKKTINSVLTSVVTAIFCVVASFVVGDKSAGTFSLMNHLDIFVLDAVLLFLIYYFFKPVWFYWVLTCLLVASALYANIGEVSGGNVLLVCALFVCMGVASVFVKNVHLFPLQKFNIPLGAWMAGFVLLDIIIEMVSGGSVTGLPVKLRVISLVCGVVLGLIGMVGKTVLSRAYGVSVNKYFLVTPPVVRLMPKIQVAGASPSARPATGAGSVAVPRKTSSPEKDDVKKSILDAKLAAMCSGPEDKAAVVSKSTAGAAPKAAPAPKATTETGKIVSSVDFS